MNREFTRYQKLPPLPVFFWGAGENCPPISAQSLPPPRGLGVRWLARNGADTALVSSTQAVGRSHHDESGVCPRPSPTALQDADAHSAAATSSRV